MFVFRSLVVTMVLTVFLATPSALATKEHERRQVLGSTQDTRSSSKNLKLLEEYQNEYDGPLDFACPSNELITRVFSVHSDWHEDRVWGFDCDEMHTTDGTPSYDSCYSTEFLNDLDAVLDAKCSVDHWVTAIQSEHDNWAEDRRWKIQCCSMKTTHGLIRWKGDFSSQFVNDLDGPMNYTFPSGNFMTGLLSENDNYHEDRAWQYYMSAFTEAPPTQPATDAPTQPAPTGPPQLLGCATFKYDGKVDLDIEIDQYMDEACMQEYPEGARAATVDEIIARSYGIPDKNTCENRLLGKCPNCEGYETSLMIGGHGRKCTSEDQAIYESLDHPFWGSCFYGTGSAFCVGSKSKTRPSEEMQRSISAGKVLLPAAFAFAIGGLVLRHMKKRKSYASVRTEIGL